MKSSRRLALALAALVAGAAPAAGQSGPARIVDGDTIEVGGVAVRLFGIDAPEAGDTCRAAGGEPYACGARASEALAEIVAGRHVVCEPIELDRYRRQVAVCRVARAGTWRDLGEAMLGAGWAVAYCRYLDGRHGRPYAARYRAAEAAARAARRGLWAGGFTAWREWGCQ